MSKLEELIKEYCPDGVEYKTLGEVCSISKGVQFNKADMQEAGSYPVINGGVGPSGYIEQYNQERDTITVSQGGASAGYVNWIETRFWAGAHCYVLTPKEVVLNRYLYHFVSSQQKSLQNSQYGAGIPSLAKATLLSLKIPVPPLPIQREIVRILDNFTQLTAELNKQLTARKKQYSFYRDQLLTFAADPAKGNDAHISRIDKMVHELCPDGVEYKALGEVSMIQRGASPRPIKNFVTDDSNGVNWIKIGDVKPGEKYIRETAEKITQEGSKKSRAVKRGDFILSNSMSFGRPYILDIDGCIHDGWLSISDFEEECLTDYLYYVLNSTAVQNEMKKKASFGGAVQNLNADIVKSLTIPLPPLEIQQKIVSILDRFDALCNDLSCGLPAEIEARQKQYEYYRDKLLSFEIKER